jgi:hypothetical protein
MHASGNIKLLVLMIPICPAHQGLELLFLVVVIKTLKGDFVKPCSRRELAKKHYVAHT